MQGSARLCSFTTLLGLERPGSDSEIWKQERKEQILSAVTYTQETITRISEMWSGR